MSALADLLSRGERRPVFVAVSLVTLVVLLQWPFADWYLRATGVLEPVEFYDAGVYFGALDAWQAGEPIYRPNESGGHFGGFLYPPLVLLLFDLFDGLPHPKWAWELFSLALLWIGLQLVVAAYGLDLPWWECGVLLWALVGFYPLWFSFKHGQVSIFLGGVLAFALVGLERGKSRSTGRAVPNGRLDRAASGALTTIAAAVKLTYLTAGAHLLGDRDRLTGAVVTGGLLVAVSLLAFGLETHLRYLDVLRWGIASGGDPRPPGLSNVAYYHPLYAVRHAGTTVRVFGVVVVGGLALAAASGDADTQTFALGVTALPLLAPQRYTYTFAALLPAVVALLAIELRRDDGRPVVPVIALLSLHVHALGLKLLVGPFRAQFGFVEALQPAYGLLQPGLWGNLLLVGLATVRVAEHASVPTWLSRGLSDVR
ncbi:glycosyltransferase family 87 protein [Halococcus agarilyticus]|uniref:glycosyltransferase family 87 protein n=1 Tax=Halococcus agarilyticus TaxID=1232219 RepID=UPI000677BA13|nr:glycosyltransferase family 87 protein [Halococcus agarilyticus]